MKRLGAIAFLLSLTLTAEAQSHRHWLSLALRNQNGVDLSYAYGWSPRWSLELSAAAQRNREIVNIFVGREGCICNSHYRDYEVRVWSYSAGALVQREFSLSKRWSAYSGAGVGYIRGPQSIYDKHLERLNTSAGRYLDSIPLDPQSVARARAGLAFRPRDRTRVALEVEHAFGAEPTLVDYSRPSVALRVGFAVR